MRETLLLGVCAGAVVGAMAWGCGGSTGTADSGASTATDAAADVTVQPDAGDAGKPPIVDASAPCINDANLNTYAAPDANVSDSGLNMATCVSCLRSKCKSVIDSCQALCECREVVTGALDCLSNGGGLACAGGLTKASPETQAIGGGLLQCIAKDCPAECPLTGVPGLPDAGPLDAAKKD